jgi:adenylyltransferase/sulfurtransferase
MPDQSILLVGAGGIGAPAAVALCEAGAGNLLVIDEDRVELSNLHRQLLFEDDDVGCDKTEAFVARLAARYPSTHCERITDRALPDNVLDLMARASVVLDATDNYPSRFLLADAAHLAGVPIVHAAAVRWQATVMACAPQGAPCYRCLFEDLPTGKLLDCATAGVAPPVCGVSGAVAADRVLRILAGDADAYRHIVTYDGITDRLRRVAVARRSDCVLCGAEPEIGAISANRYTGTHCDA